MVSKGLLLVSLTEAVHSTSRVFWTRPEKPEDAINTAQLVDKVDALKNDEKLFALIGANWCAESRNLLHAASQAFKSDPASSNSTFCFVDVEDSTNLLRDMGLETIPILLHLKNSLGVIEVEEYLGPSAKEHILHWKEQLKQNVTIPKLSTSQIKPLLGAYPVLVHCCPNILKNCGHPPLDLIVVEDDKSCDRCSLEWRGTRLNPGTDFTWNSLLTWIKTPVRVDTRTIHWINYVNQTSVLVAVYPPLSQATYELQHFKLNRVVNSVRGPLLTYEMGLDSPFERRLGEFLGLGKLIDENPSDFSAAPTLVLLKPSRLFLPKYSITGTINGAQLANFEDSLRNRISYTFPERWTDSQESEITTWLTDAINDRMEPSALLNERRPYKFDKGAGLMEVNSDTLRRALNHAETDMVIFVYTPWCTHCQLVEVELKKAAEQFSSTNISFVTFNAQENEVPPLRVNGTWQTPILGGYPTIWIKSHRLGSVIEYAGERDVASINKYISRLFKPDLMHTKGTEL